MNIKFLFKLSITLIIMIGYGCQKRIGSSAPVTVNENGEIIL